MRGNPFAGPLGEAWSANDGPMGSNPSFADLLRRSRPDAVPPMQPVPSEIAGAHGTTVLGLKFAEGVVMAGDRRAVEGFSIADERIEKVFSADERSAIAISGAAGPAIEMVKLFRVEIEHYEKVQGDRLSLEGKANRLAQMIRQNFPLAMQGLVVVPLFGGYDERREEGRLFRYDAVGGRWEEENFVATGSGGRPAKSTLKKRWRQGLSRDDAVVVAVEALRDASEEDVATGGPDPARGIYPSVTLITSGGLEKLTDEGVRAAYESLVAGEDSDVTGSSGESFPGGD